MQCKIGKFIIENVTSYVNIEVENTEGLVGGLISNLSSSTKTTLTNCKVYGDITTKGSSASGLINGINLNMDNITIKNCYYYGKLTTAEGGSKYIAPNYNK